MYAVNITDLSFGYEQPVLKNITVQFRQGVFTGILGPNGAGKSTLVKLISRWLKPQSGEILVAGQKLALLAQRQVAKLLAVVEQDNHSGVDITVRELVALGRLPHQSFLAEESAYDHMIIEKAMKKTGVFGFANRQLSTLSGGERQRVRIATALAQETEILVLDEPTSHLDIKHQLDLLRLLRELVSDGLTVIAVLHDINLAALFCDEIVMLGSGTVMRQGSPGEVLTAIELERVYGCKVVVYPHPAYQAPQVALLRE